MRRMTAFCLMAACTAALLLGGQNSAFAAAKVSGLYIDTSRYPTIGVQFDLTDPSGLPQSGLASSQLSVSDGGHAVASTGLRATGVPQKQGTDVVLLVDDGKSKDPTVDFGQTTGAPTDFVNHLAPPSRVAVTYFDRVLRPKQGFTSDAGKVKDALTNPSHHFDILSKVYDSLYAALQGLNVTGQRYAVILLTDGDDTGSQKSALPNAISYARQHSIPVFTVGLGTRSTFSGLKQIAASTGGQFFPVGGASELASMYRRMVLVFGQSYSLTYAAPTSGRHRGATETVDVRYSGQGESPVSVQGSYVVPRAPWLHIVNSTTDLGTVYDPRKLTISPTVWSEDDVSHPLQLSMSGLSGVHLSPTSVDVPPYSAGKVHRAITFGTDTGLPHGFNGYVVLHVSSGVPGVWVAGEKLPITNYRIHLYVPPSTINIGNIGGSLGDVNDLSGGHQIPLTITSTAARPADVAIQITGLPGSSVRPSLMHLPSALTRPATDVTLIVRVPRASTGQHGSFTLHYRLLTSGMQLKAKDPTFTYYIPTWWERNWKWFVPTVIILLILIYVVGHLIRDYVTERLDTHRREEEKKAQEIQQANRG